MLPPLGCCLSQHTRRLTRPFFPLAGGIFALYALICRACNIRVSSSALHAVLVVLVVLLLPPPLLLLCFSLVHGFDGVLCRRLDGQTLLPPLGFNPLAC